MSPYGVHSSSYNNRTFGNTPATGRPRRAPETSGARQSHARVESPRARTPGTGRRQRKLHRSVMFTLSARHAVAPNAVRAVDHRAKARGSARATIVRAEGADAKAASAKWSAPKLNPNAPSPIFGGSTGGLLRKAQVGVETRTTRFRAGSIALDRSRDTPRPCDRAIGGSGARRAREKGGEREAR